MLQPARVKYRRPHRVSYEGVATKGNKVEFGEFGLMACQGCYINNHQIEAARIVLASYTNRAGKVWIRIYPHLAKTKKPAEVRMGSGKGSPESWVAAVKAGRVMFEVGGVPADIAKKALRQAGFKLPCTTKVVKRTKALSEAELALMSAVHESSLDALKAEEEAQALALGEAAPEEAAEEKEGGDKE